MAQNPLGPPPPVKQDAVFDRWIRMVYQRIASAGQIIWSQIDFTGSTLTDLVTRNHADLQNLNTASYTHLTSANHTDLTDGGDSTLHYHAADRALANATGTLALANGGTGQALTDPNADRILFWDDSAGVITWLTAGSGLTITDTTITASGGGSISPPGGRLTLSSATPVMTSDVSNSTSIYYTTYLHDKIPLYDGSSWSMTTFTELTNTTTDNTKNPAAVGNNSNYDLFVWSDSGTIRLGRGPAWTSDTARGTGAGTTELERVNGIWVNKIAITNGPAAQRGTYVGTVRSNGSASIDWSLGGASAGGSPVWLCVWNCYNRSHTSGECCDNTNSWTYGTAAWRSLNNSTGNRVSFVRGLDEDAIFVHLKCYVTSSTSGDVGYFGIALDATNTNNALTGSGIGGASSFTSTVATYSGRPGLGFHYLQATEYNNNGTNTITIWGDAGGVFLKEGLQIFTPT